VLEVRSTQTFRQVVPQHDAAWELLSTISEQGFPENGLKGRQHQQRATASYRQC
jgi:hypothetical protein